MVRAELLPVPHPTREEAKIEQSLAALAGLLEKGEELHRHCVVKPIQLEGRWVELVASQRELVLNALICVFLGF